jgi:prophage regulatory protein
MSDDPRRMLTLSEVLSIIPISRSTLFRMEARGTFPASYSPSPGRRIWFADHISAWQAALPPNGRINRGHSASGRSKHLKPVD